MAQNLEKRFIAADQLLKLKTHADYGPAKMSVARENASKRFLQFGIPLNKDEYWKFCSPDGFTSHQLKTTTNFSKTSFFDNESSDDINIFFVDGILNSALSDLKVESGLEIISMNDENVTEIEWVQKLYGEIEAESQKRSKRPLSALNTACARNGLFVRVNNGKNHKLVINYIGKKHNSDSLIHNLIKVESGSELVLIEKGEGASRYNRLIEIEMLPNSKLDHVRFFGRDISTTCLNQIFVRQWSESQYKEFSLTINNEFIRNEFYVSLKGEGAKTSLAGASIGNRDNVQDDTIYIAHLKPNCQSRQVFKKVLRENSTGIFQGKIYVSSEAQKTDGYQISKGLLIGANSKFLTKPELEIYADDVICSHGSTCGAIDDESLFYLTSRGVSKEEAVSMLILAFLDEAVQEISDAKLAERIREILRLESGV